MNKNILKRLGVALILAALFLALIAYKSCNCNANNLTKADYEAAIAKNNEKIEQCEEIKNQLHITAETIRKQEFYDVDFVNSLSAKWFAQNDCKKSLMVANEELIVALSELESQEVNYRYIGDFKITHYCICSKCCGKSSSHPSYGITATGTKATPGKTIAVDSKKIPYGSKVVINGHTYTAEDCGGAIKDNKIDILVSSHSEALSKGVIYNVPVYKVEE